MSAHISDPKLKNYRVMAESYTVRTTRVTYHKVQSSPDLGRTWYGECNFLTREQAETYLFGLAERGKMAIHSFDPGNVVPTKDYLWSYTVIINGLEQRPGSAKSFRRAAAAQVAMEADVALARKHNNLQPVSQEA